MATLRDEAMNVPLAWVVVLSLPVILLFLALPFVKLATLTARERFSFVDVLLLLVATVIAFVVAFTVTPGGQLYRELFGTDWRHFVHWVSGLFP